MSDFSEQLEDIQRRMEGVSEAEALAALNDDETIPVSWTHHAPVTIYQYNARTGETVRIR